MKLNKIKCIKQILVFGFSFILLTSIAQEEKIKEDVVNDEDVEEFVLYEPQASFNGGDVTFFQQWVMEQIVYPKKAVDKKIEGKVLAQFCVNNKGELCDIVIVRGVDSLLDNEVVRVLKLSPLWKPTMSEGKAVSQKFTIPVLFKLK